MAKSKSNQKQSPDATELLLTELREIYSAESQLSKVLPRLGKVVQSEKLQKMLDRRLEQGERIIEALEKGFDKMDTTPGRKKNVAAEGLITDAREHVQEIEAGPALDAVLIGAVQKTEHYCIAAWGTAKALAEAVEESEIVRVMDRALKEGKEYDDALTGLAESEVTPALLSMSEDSEESADEDQRRSSSSQKARASGRRAAR
jgi:ferritin-like metal-binding protein YciE